MATVIFGDFEWDDEEARRNLEKHGIAFEEAASVFSDLNYVLISDGKHPDRYLALGYSSLARLLVVVHCEKAERIRIISARTATRSEASAYDQDE
ncbi:MAG: BrnT family toxin [Polyangiaceae bacterium]|nr:BrnT family toxin [Polyangiaceae bacterium]